MPNKYVLKVPLAGGVDGLIKTQAGSGRLGHVEMVGTAMRLRDGKTPALQLASGFLPAKPPMSRAGANGSATTSWSPRS